MKIVCGWNIFVIFAPSLFMERRKTDLKNCGHINLNYLFDAHFQ